MTWIIAWAIISLFITWLSLNSWDEFSDFVIKFISSGLVIGCVIGVFFMISQIEEPKPDPKKVEGLVEEDWECGSRVGGECVVMYKKKDK